MDSLSIGGLTFYKDPAADDNRLESSSIFKEQALDNGTLAFDTMDAEIFTKTAHAQVISIPAGTPLTLYRDGEVYAKFITQKISRVGKNVYQIAGQSVMSALTSMPHPGGIYTGQTVAEVVKEICGPIPVYVKTSLQDITLHGWLPYAKPPDSSARDNLNQVLFAIGASLGTDLDGVLRVEDLWDGLSVVVNQDRMYAESTVKYGSAVSAVSVTEHSYTQGSDSRELFTGATKEGDIITFDEPMHSLTAVGFAIRGHGDNWAQLSAGDGTLSGLTYIHTTREITKVVTPGAAENVRSITGATLVSLVNSNAVAERLAEYYRHTETISAPVVAGVERPGYVVSIHHPYDETQVIAALESMDITMSKTLKAAESLLVGYRPPRRDNTQYYDTSEVITVSGTWTVPEGVTSVRAVLIGGGTGGQGGAKGEDGVPPPPKTVQESGYIRGEAYSYGIQALGGVGGVGGQGGKIYEAPLEVTPGQVIQVNIGTGGPGGAVGNLTAGTEGGNTTFGPLSSASGKRVDAGYTDIFTGKVYARKSTISGTPGGNGVGVPADQADTSNTPDPGTNVGNYTPGAYGADVFVEQMDGDRRANAYGGGGGGPAMGANGGNGKRGSASITNGDEHNATGGAGGDGATPTVVPAAATNPGDGGAGGHGGGGAGCSGWTQALVYDSSGTWEIEAKISLPPMASGGNGGQAGQGAPGCVILYYQRGEAVPSGSLVDKNGLFFLDRLGRRFIV